MRIVGITFANGSYLFFFTMLIALCATIGVLAYKIQRQLWLAAFLTKSKKSLGLTDFSPAKVIGKGFLFAVALFFLFCALLRPQWGDREEIIAQEGRDVLVALDISRSMLAPDCEPNRLACAKQKIKQLLNNLNCERVGLILFSGSAFVQCPLTTDFSAFFSFLDYVDVETISSGTTSLARALQVALRVFANKGERKNKLLVIFTDGEDFSDNLSQYKEQARSEGLTVFTFGIGTPEGSPIPLYDQSSKQVGHQRDSAGNVVISRLNEEILRALAREMGGEYFALTQDSRDVQELVKHVQSFEKERFDDDLYTAKKDHYHQFLLLSLICFAGEWLL